MQKRFVGHRLDHQLRPKLWVTDKVMGNFLRALDDVLRPQSTLRGSAEVDTHAVVSQHHYAVLSDQDKRDIRQLAEGLTDLDADDLRDALERLRLAGPNLDDVQLLCDSLSDYNLPPAFRDSLERLTARYGRA